MKLRNILLTGILGFGVSSAGAQTLREADVVNYLAGKLGGAQTEMQYSFIGENDEEIQGVADIYLEDNDNYPLGIIQVTGDNEETYINYGAKTDTVEQGSKKEEDFIANHGGYFLKVPLVQNLSQLEPVVEEVKKNYFGIQSGVEEKVLGAKRFGLRQNYPNPFNNSTRIAYNLEKKGKADIDVYDIQGRKIKDLVECVQEAGDHEIGFDAGDLSSGIYFYSLNGKERKRMVITK